VEPVVSSASIDNISSATVNDDGWNGSESVSNNAPEVAQVSVECEVEPVVVSASIDDVGSTTANDDGWNGFESVSNNAPEVAQVSIEVEVEPVVVSEGTANNVDATGNDDEWTALSVATKDLTEPNSDINSSVLPETSNASDTLKGDVANESFFGGDDDDDEWADFETAPVEETSNVSVSEVGIDSNAPNSVIHSDTALSTPTPSAFVNPTLSSDAESAEINALKKLGVNCNFDTKQYMSIRELIAPLYLSQVSGTSSNNGICINTERTNDINNHRNIAVDLSSNELPKLITDKSTIEYISHIVATTIPSDALPLSQIEMPVSSHTRRTSVSIEGLLLTPLSSPRMAGKYDTANKNATNSNDELDITADFLVSHLSTSQSSKTGSGDEYDMSYMETSHSTGSSHSPSRSTNNSTKSSVTNESHTNSAVEAFLKSIPDFSFMLH